LQCLDTETPQIREAKSQEIGEKSTGDGVAKKKKQKKQKGTLNAFHIRKKGMKQPAAQISGTGL